MSSFIISDPYCYNRWELFSWKDANNDMTRDWPGEFTELLPIVGANMNYMFYKSIITDSKFELNLEWINDLTKGFNQNDAAGNYTLRAKHFSDDEKTGLLARYGNVTFEVIADCSKELISLVGSQNKVNYTIHDPEKEVSLLNFTSSRPLLCPVIY